MLNTADVCVNPDVANEMNNKSTMNKIMEYMALGKPFVQFDRTEGRYSAREASGAPGTHGRVWPQPGGERTGVAIRSAQAAGVCRLVTVRSGLARETHHRTPPSHRQQAGSNNPRRSGLARERWRQPALSPARLSEFFTLQTAKAGSRWHYFKISQYKQRIA
jgi:hypothetical protein